MFQPGNPGGPGRPRGSVSGRLKCVQALDELLSREQNLTRLDEALQAEFDRNPSRFFRAYVMPLLPKDSKLEVNTPQVAVWESLLDVCRRNEDPAHKDISSSGFEQ